ncbi:MAG: hypothetical protein L6R28_21495, partial [Planctomycetes bacterium]|nr:hypothetical protein [Planctomycetota bacterium]
MNPPARSAKPSVFPWWCIVAGGALGVMALHPYAMAVQRFLSSEGEPFSLADALRWSLHAFAPHMWPMMAFYALMGSAIGWGFAFFWDRQIRIAAHRIEVEKRQAAHQTLQELTLTVAHYIRNANAQVGGFARRLAKDEQLSETSRGEVGVVIAASAKIDAVVDALCSLQDIDATEEIGSTHLRMLDIKRMIGARIG